MKILISIHTDGAAGLVSPSSYSLQTMQAHITAEVNAAIEGAFLGGAKEVIVNDHHHPQSSLSLPDLDARASYVIGYPRYLGRLSGLDSTVNGVCMIGYPAKANSLGILAHTIHQQAFSQIQINGLDLGEAGIYGALAGQFGVPVIMASGDDIFIQETKQLMPHIHFVQTKRSLGFQSGLTLAPKAACSKITAGVAHAMQNLTTMTPFTLVAPIHTEINTTHPSFADIMCIFPTIRRIQHDRIAFSTNSIEHALRTITALSLMVSSHKID